jgi:hypothetical protein
MPRIPNRRPVLLPIALRRTWCETARLKAVSAITAKVAAPGTVKPTARRCTGCAHPPEEVGRVLLVVMRRGSLRAAEEITGHKYETIGRWLRLAAEHAEALTAKCWSMTWSSPHWRLTSSGRL